MLQHGMPGWPGPASPYIDKNRFSLEFTEPMCTLPGRLYTLPRYGKGCACGGIDCSEKQSSRPSTKSVIASDMSRMVFEKVCALELLPLSPFLKLVNLTSDTEDRALRRV